MSANKGNGSKSEKGDKPQSKEEQPRKEGGLIWLAIAIIVGVILFVWLIQAYGPKDEAVPDDLLVKQVVRSQFDAIFKKDPDQFLASYSKDYDNSVGNYDGKVKESNDILEVKFEVFDFYMDFLESGEDKVEVHIDEERRFATTFVYTYWKQRLEGEISKKPAHKLGAFLLRKEGKTWKIISDRSIPLKQEADAPRLMSSVQFRPYMNPSIIVWPPPPAAPAKNETKPEPQADAVEGPPPDDQTDVTDEDLGETGE